MSRLADPTLCPDCRGRVSPDAVCTACGLTLTGPLATQLWRSMLTSDDLVEQLRRQQAPRPDPASTTPFPAPMPRQPMPHQVGAPVAAGISGRTVPVILLGLGGLFVFVAVSLFLAVTWQVLPLAVKAALMLAFTAGVALGATVLSRKGLRGSAEAIWALVAALVALDLGAAHQSGLLGLDALSDRGTTTLVGMVLAALGVGVASWAAGTRIGRCVAAEITLVIGLLVVTVAQVWTGPGSGGLSPSIGVPALVGVALLLRPRFREASYGVLGLALLTWADLAVLGAGSGVLAASRSAFWSGFDGWPLLVAAGYAAAAVAVRRLPAELRTSAAGASLASLSLLALVPWDWHTLDVLLLAAVVLALAAVTAWAPRPWALAAGALGGIGVVVALGALVISPVVWTLTFVDRHALWSTAPDASFPVGGGPSAWTVLALLGAALAVAAAGLRLLGRRTDLLRPVLVTAAPAAIALAAATGLAGSRLPLWVVVAGFAAAATVAVVGTLRGTGWARAAGLALAAESGLVALVVATRSDLVTGVLASTLAVIAVTAYVLASRRAADEPLAVLAAAATVLLTGYAAGAWTLVAGSGAPVRAEVLTAVACVFLLAAAYVTGRRLPRTATELSSGAVGVAAVVIAAPHESTVALVLTVLGTAVALVSVLHRDRVHAGWLGSAVLTASTLVRLEAAHTIGVSGLGPEVYTFPAAALLIGAGVHRLLREPAMGTWQVLGSGLTLALGPSVLLALPDPSSLRALLVGIGAALALSIGMERRWQAPFLVGAAVLILLALRFLGPLALDVLANPLGAWMLFGSAGAACLAAGILWEQSLNNLRVASRYLAALR